MQFFIKKNKILIFIALIGLIASLVPIGARIGAEENNKKYDLILDYSSLRAMELQSNISDDEWLDLFRSLGVDKVALTESTIKSLTKTNSIPIHAAKVSEITSNFNWEMRFPQTVVDWVKNSKALSDILVIAENKKDFDWIESALKQRTNGLIYQTYEEDGASFILIPTQNNGLVGSDYLNLCIGIWPEYEERIKSHGFQIIPRTVTFDNLNDEKYAKAFISVLEKSDTPYFLNSGDSLLGYDTEEGTALLMDYLKESGVSIGLFEENDQSQNLVWDGIEDLLENTGYHGIRVFNEWSYIQNRYEYCGYEGPEEITNSFFRAIAERNCKVIFLKMILEADNDVKVDADESEWIYVTEKDAYKQMLEDLDRRLGALDYSHETVTSMNLKTPSVIFRLLEGIGVSALLVILIDLFLRLKQKNCYILFGIIAVLLSALCIVKLSGFIMIISMLGGIVMPSLAAVGLCRILANRKTMPPIGTLLLEDVWTSVLAIFTAFCGSILATSALSQMSFIIEIDLYRGVKLMQLIPIGLFALGYLLVFAYEQTGAHDAVIKAVGPRGSKERGSKFISYLKNTLNRPLKLSWFVVVVIIAVAGIMMLGIGVYYIYRTGNATNVSSLELQFRNILENLLIARPRTKEMLIGWPCLMLFIWSIRRGMRYLPFAFGLFGSIGLVSVVNTFLHIRTPFLLSLLRTGWGMLFGIILGIIAVLVCEGIRKLIINNFGKAENV